MVMCKYHKTVTFVAQTANVVAKHSHPTGMIPVQQTPLVTVAASSLGGLAVIYFRYSGQRGGISQINLLLLLYTRHAIQKHGQDKDGVTYLLIGSTEIQNRRVREMKLGPEISHMGFWASKFPEGETLLLNACSMQACRANLFSKRIVFL